MGLSETIRTLTTAFAKIDRIDPDSQSYRMLRDILDRADDGALTAIHGANIRFVSKLAFNRMIRRGLVATI